MDDEVWTDAALVCMNGHVVNAASEMRPNFNSNYCPTCGERAISKCLNCQSQIPGQIHFLSDDMLGDGDKFMEPAPYCGGCGKPYPWTERRAQAFIELAHLTLNAQDAQEVEENLPDVMRDSPRTEVAVRKINGAFAKAGTWGLNTLKTAAPSLLTQSAMLLLEHLLK